jgi:hypothetical protein
MEEKRISIRLSSVEHKKIRIYAIKNNTNIQKLVHEYLISLLEIIKNEKKS